MRRRDARDRGSIAGTRAAVVPTIPGVARCIARIGANMAGVLSVGSLPYVFRADVFVNENAPFSTWKRAMRFTMCFT